MSIQLNVCCFLEYISPWLPRAALLREYPPAFAEKIRALFPGLVTGGEGTPEISGNFATSQEVFFGIPMGYLEGSQADSGL